MLPALNPLPLSLLVEPCVLICNRWPIDTTHEIQLDGHEGRDESLTAA
jgi:hypothetical protein